MTKSTSNTTKQALLLPMVSHSYLAPLHSHHEKRGFLFQKATESARLAVYIMGLLYITDFGYCHRSVPTSTKAFLAFPNILEASLVPLKQIHEIPNPSNFTA